MAETFQSTTIRVADGGRFMPDKPLAAVGIANYITKDNWRREGYGDNAEEVAREGSLYFKPNSGGSATNQRIPAGGSAIIATGEARRSNGKTAPVAISAAGGVYYFNYDTSAWVSIGSGYSQPPSGRRWQIISVGTYTVFNNGIDLPFTWLVGDAAVSPIHELREQGIASVGTIWESNQILMCGDVLEILPASMSGIMNGGTPYGQVTNPAQTQRIQFRINWSNTGDPRDFAATVTATATNGSPTLTLAWPMASFAIGNEITVIGAGPSGGNLVTTISNISGVTVTMANNASTSISNTPTQKTTALNSIVGFYDLEDDGSAILRGLPLQNRIVVYKPNSIFVGYYTGDVDEPFVFEQQYRGNRTPRFRWTLISVGGKYHLYAGDDSFYVFKLGVQEPEVQKTLDDCKRSCFYDTPPTNESGAFACDNACNNEVFIFNSANSYALAYDYSHECASKVTMLSQIQCAATIHKPLAGLTVDERELWFVMGDASGDMFQWGRTNLAVVAYTRASSGLAEQCNMVTGIGHFGDAFNQKDVRTWALMNSCPGPVTSILFDLFGTDRENLTTTVLETKTIESSLSGTPTIVPLFYRKTYFQEGLYCTPTSLSPVRIYGRIWEVARVRSRAITRIAT